MRKQRKDTTRGYKINFATNTLTLNYKFADAAFNDYGSPEYVRMKAILADFFADSDILGSEKQGYVSLSEKINNSVNALFEKLPVFV